MKTHIVYVIDASGSMMSQGTEPVDCINESIKEHLATEGKKTFSVLKFNTGCDWLYRKAKKDDALTLTYGEDYVASGGTALNDAIGLAINEFEGKERVAISIYTDGHENSSVEFSAENVKRMVADAKERGWLINFMFADPQSGMAAKAAYDLADKAMLHGGVEDVMRTATMATTMYAAGESVIDINLADLETAE